MLTEDLQNSSRKVLTETGDLFESSVQENAYIISGGIQINGCDSSFLKKKNAPTLHSSSSVVSLVDLFCGAGGISLGVAEAISDVGKSLSIPLAVDFEANAINVYRDNFPQANVVLGDLSDIFLCGDVDAPLTKVERELQEKVGVVDILVGGPPCQGHSDLNNYSRRNDPKNSLYFIMARAAKVLRPKVIFIENVLGARHDKNGVVNQTVESLREQGYFVDVQSVDLIDIGVAQKRRRLVILATKKQKRIIADVVELYRCSQKDVRWAIGDLEDSSGTKLSDKPSTPSKDNRARIDYLFDNDIDDLPDNQRPPCHQHGNHSYKSVYGRLKWSEPSQTITSGFYSMCMGRYVHPSRRRTLTAHEAARLQFFPDYFSFESAGSRTAIAKIIGNAVPPKLSYVFAHSIFGDTL
ncbi:DNA cytosine methyltransferase [Pseudomonas protegens]|uniref:DNA cytosine methyltransferase n=1 Tax=Pseudomonas protegens TaxID=380021 RepID=UPI001C6947EE|nr:DNA cytosine methyltransferase [Pseudomonas protegens]QYN02365.1 DNA cytosine methyltransferase [Pseudomonas protegens]